MTSEERGVLRRNLSDNSAETGVTSAINTSSRSVYELRDLVCNLLRDISLDVGGVRGGCGRFKTRRCGTHQLCA